MGICDFDPVLDFEDSDLDGEPEQDWQSWYGTCWDCVEDCDSCVIGGLQCLMIYGQKAHRQMMMEYQQKLVFILD